MARRESKSFRESGIWGGEVAFEVADDSGNSTGEEAEAAADTPDEKWVETIKT